MRREGAHIVGLPKETWKVPYWGQFGSICWFSTFTSILDVPNPGQNTSGCLTLHTLYNQTSLIALSQHNIPDCCNAPKIDKICCSIPPACYGYSVLVEHFQNSCKLWSPKINFQRRADLSRATSEKQQSNWTMPHFHCGFLLFKTFRFFQFLRLLYHIIQGNLVVPSRAGLNT